jgi:hypothetical protein
MKSHRTGSSVEKDPGVPPVVSVQLPLPLLDVLADMKTSFFGLCLTAGQQVFQAMMEQVICDNYFCRSDCRSSFVTERQSLPHGFCYRADPKIGGNDGDDQWRCQARTHARRRRAVSGGQPRTSPAAEKPARPL